MSEFKFVQWGKGVPVDYQRLNAMMLNDQYLKDKVDPSPRGILIWREVAQPGVTGGLGYNNFANFSNLTFDVEANRMIKITWDPGQATANTYSGFYIQVVVDLAVVSVIRMNIAWANGINIALTPTTAILNSLSQGSHTISVQGASDPTATWTGIGTARLIVEDIGQAVAES